MIRAVDRRDIQEHEQTLVKRCIIQYFERVIHLMFGRARVRHPERHPPVAVLEVTGQDTGEGNFLLKKITPPIHTV